MPEADKSIPLQAPASAVSAGARSYIDLSIELRDLDEAAGTFVVTVLPSGVGESTPLQVALKLNELEADLQRLEAKKLSAARLIVLGEQLGERLLPPGEVRDLFKAALAKAGRDGGVRLRLILRDAKLAQLPWEYAYIQGANTERHRSHFLLLNPQVSMVRHEVIGGEPWPLVAANPTQLRIVVATASVTHANIDQLGEFDFAKLDLDLERNAITAAVRELKADGVTVDASRVLNEATIHDLTAALLPGADVFHFAGHGYFASLDTDPEAPSSALGGFILLQQAQGSREGTALRADDLAMLLQRAGVRIAVLGACDSARRDNTSPWNSVAPALVRRGLSAAVAMQYEVVDDKATAFSRMLYTAIAAGLSLDEAVSAGRQAMLADGGGISEWGVPVLYMRSANGVLFPEIIVKPTIAGHQIQVAVNQVIDTIESGGEVAGIRAEQLTDGSFSVKQEVKVVKGAVVGIELGRVGRRYDVSQDSDTN